MSFPGGMADDEDMGDIVTTALRETVEEIGVPPHEVQGALVPVDDVSLVCCHPPPPFPFLREESLPA